MKLKIIETSQCPAGAHPGNESRTSHTKHRLVSPPPPHRRAADLRHRPVFTQQQICVIQHGPSYIKPFHEHTNTPLFKDDVSATLIRLSVTCVVISKMILISPFCKFITAADAFSANREIYGRCRRHTAERD